MITKSKLLLSSFTLSILFLSLPAHSIERIAVFAGGCFWCMEEAYEKVYGVTEVVSGYSGGRTTDPTYQKVTGGNTGHHEAVQVYYDDTKVNYEELLQVFWTNIDPLDDGGQFCDRGSSYKSALFYLDDEQLKLARSSLTEVNKKLSRKVVTPLLKFDRFYAAEDYHQDYYKTNPVRYKYYKTVCGRPARLQQLWG